MKFNIKNLLKVFKKNSAATFFVLTLLLAIISTQFYNNQKKIISENYKDVIHNTYFQKSLNYIFNNLNPKFTKINHKISQGETFYTILNNYEIADNEIAKLKKVLDKDADLNNLKLNQIIKFTVDSSKNKKIVSFYFPTSRTKKIQ